MAMTDGVLKALVIDDSPTDARILSNLLSERLQTEVEIAKDGLEGLEKLGAGHFDLAFLDLQMPRMTGMEVLRKIRGTASTANLPVIVITSDNDAQTVRSLVEFKILDYVIKPYNTALIVKRFSEKLVPLRSCAAPPGADSAPR
jgi:two-component system, chemotaxis family, chemotaxis protein CheY